MFLSPASFSVPQVARAGRFGTKGLAITFVSDETDAKTLNDVQDRFEVNVAELPEEIDISSYSKFCCSSQVALYVMMLTFSNQVLYMYTDVLGFKQEAAIFSDKGKM